MLISRSAKHGWSAMALLAAGAAFLIFGAPTRSALAGAGFALVGAGITRSIDIALARSDARDRFEADRRRDLDETRRVASMALLAGQAPRHYELVATAANALAHHGLRIPFDEAANHLATVANGATDGESAAWLRGKIDAITKELQD